MAKKKRHFCCHQNSVPNGLSAPARGYKHLVKHEKKVHKIGQGVVCPCPGTIYIYKIIKNVYKIRFQRDHPETNLQQMGKVIRVSVDINICPQGVVCPCPGAIYICMD